MSETNDLNTHQNSKTKDSKHMTVRLSPTMLIILVSAFIAAVLLARGPGTPAAAPVAVAPVATVAPVAAVPTTVWAGDAAAAPATAAPAAAPVAAAPAQINIQDFAYNGQLSVAPGQALNITNLDGVAHTLTANDGAFDTGNLNGGESAPLTAPSAPGSYAFFCSLHPSMTGTLVVQ